MSQRIRNLGFSNPPRAACQKPVTDRLPTSDASAGEHLAGRPSTPQNVATAPSVNELSVRFSRVNPLTPA